VRVPFERLHHLVTVPAAVNGVEAPFVLDTGIGLTLLSTWLQEEAGCELTGARFSGRRMSGQEVEVPMAAAHSLRLGPVEQIGLEVGVIDLGELSLGSRAVGGFLSLAYFAEAPFTFDYAGRAVVIETPSSLDERRRAGDAVELSLERDGPSLVAFMPLTIPGGRSMSVAVDTGSETLILDGRFASEVGIDLERRDLRRVEGTDETGHAFVRTFARLAGIIHPTDEPELAQTEPEVMFQRIIHDGLIGDAFLRRYSATFDVETCSLILGPGEGDPGGAY
jgi:predicted aspartyl protease